MKYQQAIDLAQQDANRTGITMAVVGDAQGRRNLFSIMSLQSAKSNGIHIWKVVESQADDGEDSVIELTPAQQADLRERFAEFKARRASK